MNATHPQLCDRALIHAYIDGELDARLQTLFEDHLESCKACRDELQAHRMFVCDLDSVMVNGAADISVPANFSRVVAARATSDMSGVRSAAENRKALVFCVILAFAGVGLIGSSARDLAVHLGQKLYGMIVGIVGFGWNAVYDFIASIAVISRVLSRRFIVETGRLGLVLVLLALAVMLLSRLISSYHRTGATE
jgi:predicted anti-sigma-YlaC factor YlaD